MLPTSAGVYVIENTESGRVYVGSAVNLRARRHTHWGSLQRGCHKNAHLQSAWDKYGSDAFVMRPLLICDRSDVVFFEQRAMDVLLKDRPGYNKAPQAGNNFGIKRSPEYIAKMAASKRGVPKSVVAKANHAAAMAREETRSRISAAKRGVPHSRPVSDAHRAALSASQIGKVVSPETRAKLAAINLGKKRGPHSEETKLRIASAQKGRPLKPEHVAALRQKKGIAKYEFDGRSLTLREWSEETGICLSSLQKRIGYGWTVERALTAPVQRH